MVIRDFDRQKYISAIEVSELVRCLPREHTQNIQSIWYKPASEFVAIGVPVEAGIKGAYFPEYRTIVVYDLVSKSLAKHIIAHEIGHYVYQTVLTSYKRKEWAQQIGGKPPFVSEYARTNVAEDFSECYATYTLNSNDIKLSSKKANFLRVNVFR
ncbi:hypothetical protein TDB9533_02898 [Thalassocella blandensis]|nr:hypothetical protein TDB9533_02898 [Thalassocella blandensis]